MTRPQIALLTDFGLKDPYVGIMKGVMRSICPEAEFIDLTHEVRPQGVAEAAFLLANSIPYFPEETIFLCVVDPGVGSDRAALAVEIDEHLFVAPDNGLLSLVWRQAEERAAHLIVNPSLRLPEVSSTFHGRDIFAPAAAHLARGVEPEEFGPAVLEIETIGLFQPLETEEGELRGAVVHIDHFGNLVSNIREEDLPEGIEDRDFGIEVAGQMLDGIHLTYSAVRPQQSVAHWGSSGFLEIGLRNGNFAQTHGVEVGAPVSVHWHDEDD